MKIVIIVQHLTNGGAERVATLWANGFAQKGHQVTVVITHDHTPVTYALLTQVKLVSIDTHKKNRTLGVVERMWKLRGFIKAEKPQAVIDVMPSFNRIIARLGLGCCNISTEHNSFERPESAEHRISWRKKYLLNRLYDHVTVLTQVDRDVIGRRLKHVTVLPNPLALEPVDSVPPKEKVVLAVGRKDAWKVKGFDVLIKAWAQVSHHAFGWKLRIVGGSDRGGQELLEHLCEKYGVTGSVDLPNYQNDIQAYYRQAAIFVLGSRYEGFGLVLIEAMSQGCACIACDYKGRQSEIVTDGVDGVTCEPDNVEALVRALRKVIGDEELRVQLQATAIRRAEDFRIDRIMERWEEIFEKLSITTSGNNTNQ